MRKDLILKMILVLQDNFLKISFINEMNEDNWLSMTTPNSFTSSQQWSQKWPYFDG